MKRTTLAASIALAVATLAACQQDPGGRCAADADCKTGQHCSNGICLSDLRQEAVGQSCYVDKDCVTWASCVQNQCLLEPGACDTTADCQPWQACNTGHACEMVAGGCANESDCAGWQNCNTSTWRCETAPGFCADEAGCAAWQDCGTDHRCALAPNACLVEADCQPWQDCGSDHFCALTPGMCASSADCDPWEACSPSNVCAVLADRCNVDADCVAWKACDATHSCALRPGSCNGAADCQPWQTCDAAHVCTDDALDSSAAVITGGFEGAYLYRFVGFARPEEPTQARYNTDIYVLSAVIDPAGRFVYATMADGGWQVRRFAPDALRWDPSWNEWAPPLDPLGNDPVLAASGPGCFSIVQFVLQASSGALLYECPDDVTSSPSWRDETGTERVAGGRVVAWTAGGVMLWMESSTALQPTHVIDAAGGMTAITGLPAGSTQHARVAGDGFRVALFPAADPTRPESWTIGTDGVALFEGTFAAPPAGTNPSTLYRDGVLDGAGNLVQYDWDGVIVRRPLEPGASSILYTKSVPAGANDKTAVPFQPYLTTDATTMVVTGP